MQGDRGEREREGEIDGGGEEDRGNVCLLSNKRKTFNVNLASKQIALVSSVLPSPLTVHTISEIFKEASFYERPRMEKHFCCRRKRRRE